MNASHRSWRHPRHETETPRSPKGGRALARIAIVSGAILVAASVGYLGGRWNGPAEAVADRWAPPRVGGTAAGSGVPFGTSEAGAPAAATAAGAVESDFPELPSPVAWEAALVGAEEGSEEHSGEGCADHAGCGADLADEAPDAEETAALMASLRAATDPGEAFDMAARLGDSGDPAVEAFALEMAETGATPAVRAAAFDLLDRLDTPAAVEPILDTLARERDPVLRQAALMALPEPAGVDRAEAGRVLGALTHVLARDGDAESRRLAAIGLGTWHGTADDLLPVVTALKSDPASSVRAGAAFAIELAGTRDQGLVGALVKAIGDPTEDDLVRENAWHALGASGPLPPEAAEAYRAYAARSRQE